MAILEHHLILKPISANIMFAGSGRNIFKQKKYKMFQQKMCQLLSELGTEWPFENNPVSFNVEVGLSSRQSDLDNVIKPILDTYQLFFNGDFNDRNVSEIYLLKKFVRRKHEYFKVRISDYLPAPE